jgi:integrase
MADGWVFTRTGPRGVAWLVKYRDADGKQVKATLGREPEWNRELAERELHRRLDQVDKGWRKPPRLTFAKASELWAEETSVEKRWKPATVAQYRSIRARLDIAFGDREFSEVRPSDVTAFKTRMLERYEAASVSRDLSILHSIFRWGVVSERLERNPADGVPHPQAAKRKGNALRPEEVQALLRAFTDEQDRLVFLTVCLTALRRSELQALRWADVDLIENRLRVVDSKTETGARSVALSTSLAERLWQHRSGSRYKTDTDSVFCNQETGSPYRYETFSDALRAAYATAGMVWPEGMRPFHDLRVTAITNDAIAGANPVALMTKAGHASMATTRRYLRLAGVVFTDEAEALERRMLGLQAAETAAETSQVPKTGTKSSFTALPSRNS